MGCRDFPNGTPWRNRPEEMWVKISRQVVTTEAGVGPLGVTFSH